MESGQGAVRSPGRHYFTLVWKASKIAEVQVSMALTHIVDRMLLLLELTWHPFRGCQSVPNSLKGHSSRVPVTRFEQHLRWGNRGKAAIVSIEIGRSGVTRRIRGG